MKRIEISQKKKIRFVPVVKYSKTEAIFFPRKKKKRSSFIFWTYPTGGVEEQEMGSRKKKGKKWCLLVRAHWTVREKY